MGTWSYKPLDNDDAADWYTDLLDQDSLTPIKDAFSAVTAPAGKKLEYIELPESASALAAAYVLFVLTSNGTSQDDDEQETIEELREWFIELDKRTIPLKWLKAADIALKNIKDINNSELAQIWSDSEDCSKWLSNVDSLASFFETSLNDKK
jgi:replication fork clamp-binding protein CrfC